MSLVRNLFLQAAKYQIHRRATPVLVGKLASRGVSHHKREEQASGEEHKSKKREEKMDHLKSNPYFSKYEDKLKNIYQ